MSTEIGLIGNLLGYVWSLKGYEEVADASCGLSGAVSGEPL